MVGHEIDHDEDQRGEARVEQPTPASDGVGDKLIHRRVAGLAGALVSATEQEVGDLVMLVVLRAGNVVLGRRITETRRWRTVVIAVLVVGRGHSAEPGSSV